ncbi:hypothetical protein HNY73_000144 [Argiope bruennichi]|uniref:Uncharacterized protein n=1 Tax=Argiope bruennichi TaxID=94029 RepID=A0A8T0FY35_ARGBR|nr:hypothetical protein HNY73_000144 [Argiope bruennichi]
MKEETADKMSFFLCRDIDPGGKLTSSVSEQLSTPRQCKLERFEGLEINVSRIKVISFVTKMKRKGSFRRRSSIRKKRGKSQTTLQPTTYENTPIGHTSNSKWIK